MRFLLCYLAIICLVLIALNETCLRIEKAWQVAEEATLCGRSKSNAR
jgi:hypothetical protein